MRGGSGATVRTMALAGTWTSVRPPRAAAASAAPSSGTGSMKRRRVDRVSQYAPCNAMAIHSAIVLFHVKRFTTTSATEPRSTAVAPRWSTSCAAVCRSTTSPSRLA